MFPRAVREGGVERDFSYKMHDLLREVSPRQAGRVCHVGGGVVCPIY